MKKTPKFLQKQLPAVRRGRDAAVCALALAASAATASAQSSMAWLATAPAPNRAMLFGAAGTLTAAGTSSSLAPAESEDGAAMLPEAPAPQLAMEPKPKHGTDPSEHIAQKWTMTIPSDWKAQRLSAGDKVKAGLTDTYSFQTVASWFLAAGWEQLLNGSPNYGTDKGAFGQRLGAAAIRGTSQNIFSEVVLAPLLHEDARYYVEGPKYGLVHRAVYAATRPLVTRNDEGKSTVNAAVLIGYAGAAALTPTYYPQINHNFKDVASVYGGGIGGAALGYFITEFSQDALRTLHLAKKP